jgi:hypothetical protein
MYKFCVVGGCNDVAIRGARSMDHCRPHYRSEVLAKATDLVTCEVIASRGSRGEAAGVTDCVTNETVRFGATVTLDPQETQIPALVAGGIVKVLARPVKTKE